MSYYEILTLCVSSLAVVVSLVAIIRTRKVDTAMLRLEEVHAELSKKQIELIEKEKKEQEKASIKVELVKYSRSDYKFHITNHGRSPARNIRFSLTQNCNDNPLVMGEYKDKIPYPLLNPDETFTLIAAITLGMSSTIFPVEVIWQNEDGSDEKRVCVTSF
ncbi:hypothetical protein [Endozoicomonas sp. ALE010]|uniref:hypothetical protein n=1 Tax=Endozoicomonas sp. ALE010 TaxID=3403081 RepID=UPI003BB57B37